MNGLCPTMVIVCLSYLAGLPRTPLSLMKPHLRKPEGLEPLGK